MRIFGLDIPPKRSDPLRTDRSVLNSLRPLDFEWITKLVGSELDILPYGIIAVDLDGNVIEYNATEAGATGFNPDRVIGRNFFRDVAPCTAVRSFEGRFLDFVKGGSTSVAPFEFVFNLPSGPQNVQILFLRMSANAEQITIAVMRRDERVLEGNVAGA